MKKLSAWSLGATMYVPAMHKDLSFILSGTKGISSTLAQPRSLVICLEDAVREDDLPEALIRLESALKFSEKGERLHFIRPRNIQVFREILKMNNIENIHGFVLPKVTNDNIHDYLAELPENHGFYIMPTLETAEVFDIESMKKLRESLLSVKEQILAIRVGGNDLLNCLGMRRPKSGTIYDTPVGLAIHNLLQIFKPFGFDLTAPVFEIIDRMELLEEEVKKDLMCGLVCKTAIHPTQIHIIEKHYVVNQHDVEMATAILEPDAPAVFKMNGTMCEPATHKKWAEQTLIRLNVYGNLK